MFDIIRQLEERRARARAGVVNSVSMLSISEENYLLGNA